MSKLYVIGNGFDLAHNIHCKYSDFKIYCEQYAQEMYQRMNLFYTDTDKLWCDFEAEMPNINENKLFDWARNLPNQKRFPLLNDDDRFIKNVQDEVDFMDGIKVVFRDWIMSIDINHIEPLFQIDPGSKFITFNYTKLLERVYSVSRHNIIYIHGVAEGNFPTIIVGHDKSDTELQVMFQYNNGLENEACQEIVDLVKGWRKDTTKIINEYDKFFTTLGDVKEVVVLGHSMANVDMPYFNKETECIDENSKWIFSVYDKRDEDRKKDAIRELELPQNRYKLISLEKLAID